MCQKYINLTVSLSLSIYIYKSYQMMATFFTVLKVIVCLKKKLNVKVALLLANFEILGNKAPQINGQR